MQRMSLKRVFLIALALIAFFGCQSSCQANQHRLVIDTPHGQDMLRDFVARYKQAHPDPNVHEYTADGTLLMKKLARQEGLVSLWNLPDVRLYQEQKKLPVAYNFPTSGTPVVTDGIAIARGAPHEEEAKRFYEFVTTPESLVHAARNYYRMPTRTDIDRKQFPGLDEPAIRTHTAGLGTVTETEQRMVALLGCEHSRTKQKLRIGWVAAVKSRLSVV